jgi:hypothetical protein
MKLSNRSLNFFSSPGRKAGDRVKHGRVFAIDPQPFGLGGQTTNPRAFVAIDMLFGIIIIGGITIALAATVRHERSAEDAMAESRSALHLAEHALLNLQHGQRIPSLTLDEHLTIHPVNDGSAPPGFIWAKVNATVHGHQQSILGVVPTGLIAPEAKS